MVVQERLLAHSTLASTLLPIHHQSTDASAADQDTIPREMSPGHSLHDYNENEQLSNESSTLKKLDGYPLRFIVRTEDATGFSKFEENVLEYDRRFSYKMVVTLSTSSDEQVTIELNDSLLNLLSDGKLVRISEGHDTIILERVYDPYFLALHGSMFASVTPEEIEEISRAG